jgi:hypothetical protein
VVLGIFPALVIMVIRVIRIIRVRRVIRVVRIIRVIRLPAMRSSWRSPCLGLSCAVEGDAIRVVLLIRTECKSIRITGSSVGGANVGVSGDDHAEPDEGIWVCVTVLMREI